MVIHEVEDPHEVVSTDKKTVAKTIVVHVTLRTYLIDLITLRKRPNLNEHSAALLNECQSANVLAVRQGPTVRAVPENLIKVRREDKSSIPKLLQ
jgi:hypothetical protein